MVQNAIRMQHRNVTVFSNKFFIIIELENITESSNEDKMTILMSKIKLLGQEYTGSPHCFPIGNYILHNN